MLTIFACPRPFTDQHIKTIQTNAIRSWTLLDPTPEIILLGDEEGISNIANELQIRHIKDIKLNQYNTPYLNSIFETAQIYATNNILCYVNADIILLQDFMDAVKSIKNLMNRFLIVGQRWDLDLTSPINLNSSKGVIDFYLEIIKKGTLHEPVAIDYFVFSVGTFVSIPSFIVGRIYWDHWLPWRARSLNIPIVDITNLSTAVHQNHDKSHVVNGVITGSEALWNKKLVGAWLYRYWITHSTYELTPRGLRNRFFHPFIERFMILVYLFIHGCIYRFSSYFPPLKKMFLIDNLKNIKRQQRARLRLVQLLQNQLKRTRVI